jgi:hypothetical protein
MTLPRIAGLLIALALLALPGAAGAADFDWGPATQIDHSGSTPVQGLRPGRARNQGDRPPP